MSDFQKRLTVVDEQTKMLLEQQLAAKKYCDEEFSDLLSLIDQKVQETDEQDDDYKSLIRVHELVSDQYSKFVQDVEEDIQFLKEQLKAIEEVKKIENEKRAEELFLSVLDEDEELMETEEFRKTLSEEADFAKRGFVEIIKDIKNSLQEGNLEDLEVALHSMDKEREDREEGLDIFEDDDDEENDRDDSGCSGCSGCSSKKEGCGIDLFSDLFDDEDEKDEEDK
ncbi:MAG: hypothetical protein ABIA74_03630 [bacterium]